MKSVSKTTFQYSVSGDEEHDSVMKGLGVPCPKRFKNGSSNHRLHRLHKLNPLGRICNLTVMSISIFNEQYI